MAGTLVTGNETSPTDRRGSWIVAEFGELGTPITGNETSPTDRRGSWLVLEDDTPATRGTRNLGLSRGARSVT